MRSRFSYSFIMETSSFYIPTVTKNDNIFLCTKYKYYMMDHGGRQFQFLTPFSAIYGIQVEQKDNGSCLSSILAHRA